MFLKGKRFMAMFTVVITTIAVLLTQSLCNFPGLPLN